MSVLLRDWPVIVKGAHRAVLRPDSGVHIVLLALKFVTLRRASLSHAWRSSKYIPGLSTDRMSSRTVDMP